MYFEQLAIHVNFEWAIKFKKKFYDQQNPGLEI